jgi:hypothetical protein
MTIWHAGCIDAVISPDDGHSRLKHIEKRNKHTKKNCAPSWPYLQDYTRMHGQENIKNAHFGLMFFLSDEKNVYLMGHGCPIHPLKFKYE